MKGTKRTARVAQLIRREIGALLLTLGHGDQFSRVVVTDCRVTPDLRIAHIYYTILGDEGREGARTQAQSELERARGGLRHELGRLIRTKYTPELAFHYDETLDHARRIEELLERLDVQPPHEPESTES